MPGNRPIHVLMLTTDSEICGTERIMLSLLRHLDRERFTASVVTMMGPGDLVEEVKTMGYPAVNLRLKENSIVQGLKTWSNFLNTYQPDVIQSLLVHSNLLGRLTVLFKRKIALLAGISTVYTIEGYGWKYAWYDRYTHFLDTLYCVNSELGMKQVKEIIRLPDKKLALVHNGVQLGEEPSDTAALRKEVRNEFGFSDEDLVVGIVAQLRPAKRHDILIHAIAALHKEFPQVKLLIVGEGETIEQRKALVESLNISDQVIFTGYRSDARRLMRGMDIFALPSEVEGEPVSVMEAMDAELPVIAAATGGIPEIVRHGKTGLLSTPGDQDGFTASLRNALREPERIKEMGHAGKARVREKFTAERMTREFEELYERCLRLKGFQ